MTVPVETSQVVYTGDGANLVFPTVFVFLLNAHIVVEVQVGGVGSYIAKTLGVDYNLAGQGTGTGGTVTFATAPGVGDVVRISRTLLVIQTTSFRTQGTFSPTVHENEFDYVIEVCQMLLRRIQALEAGAISSTYTAARFTKTFTVLDPAESTFPQSIVTGPIATLVLGRVQNLTTPTEVLYAPPELVWHLVGVTAVIDFVSGLTPGQQYTITVEART